MQNREKFVGINKNCGQQLCNLPKKFSLFCTKSGKFFLKVCAICLLTKLAECGIMELRGAARENAPSKCTKIFNIFKNFCIICTLCKLHNGILTNQPLFFLCKFPKSIGKVNKPHLLSLVILPIDF